MSNTDRSAGVGTHPHEHEALLLLGRPADEGAAAYCRDHLASRYAPDSAPVVVLTDRPLSDRSQDWNYGGNPGVVIAVGESTRSGAGAVEVPVSPASPPDTVVAAGDLGTIGGTVDEVLTTWVSAGHRPVVCVDSIDGLLEQASIGAVYRMLYVLLHRLEETEGSVHAHADPRQHEEEILRTFFSLFDRVISFQDGGAVSR